MTTANGSAKEKKKNTDEKHNKKYKQITDLYTMHKYVNTYWVFVKTGFTDVFLNTTQQVQVHPAQQTLQQTLNRPDTA